MNIVIWGTGNNAELFIKLIGTDTVVCEVVDGIDDRVGEKFHNYVIKKIEDIKMEKVDYIAVCSLSYNEIAQKIVGMGIDEKKIVIAVAEYYTDCSMFEDSVLKRLLSNDGINHFAERIDRIEKKKRYGIVEREIIKKIDSIEFDTNCYPLSVYNFSYSPEVELAGKICNFIMHKYGLKILHKNHFGYKMLFNVECDMTHLVQNNFPADVYPFLSFLNKYVPNVDCSVDIGANLGFVTCFLSRISTNVHSFEPGLETTEMAMQNLQLNGINNVKWNRCGCGEENGEKEYYDLGDSSGNNSFIYHNLEAKKVYKVPVITLDTYCLENGIDYIDILKIDVEGYEPYVIKGCKQLLGNKKIGIIIFEVGALYGKDEKEEMLNTLLEADFNFYNVYGDELSIEQILDVSLHLDVVGINRCSRIAMNIGPSISKADNKHIS